MVRTKRQTAKALVPITVKTEKDEIMDDIRADQIRLLNKIKEAKEQLANQHNEKKLLLKEYFRSTLSKIPLSVRNKTVEELSIGNIWSNLSKSVATETTMRSRLQRSSSDDGYSTSESRGTSGMTRTATKTRKSRRCGSSDRTGSSTLEKNKEKRVSRSVSRSAKPAKILCESSSNKFKTPKNSKTLNSFSIVTPKMKPNTPSVVLRRPMQGEIAVSLQGSPLMTTAMVSETTANINIPLGDGRMINVQPIRGLRRSDIPDLDPEVRQQLLTLKENLEKVCNLERTSRL